MYSCVMNDISRVETYKSLANQTELALFQINSDQQLTFTNQHFEHLLDWG